MPDSFSILNGYLVGYNYVLNEKKNCIPENQLIL